MLHSHLHNHGQGVIHSDQCTWTTATLSHEAFTSIYQYQTLHQIQLCDESTEFTAFASLAPVAHENKILIALFERSLEYHHNNFSCHSLKQISTIIRYLKQTMYSGYNKKRMPNLPIAFKKATTSSTSDVKILCCKQWGLDIKWNFF